MLARGGLRAEIRAQLDEFEDTMGCLPDFVDGHHHVHQLPIVRQELLDELDERYAVGLPWLRSTRRPAADARSRLTWRGAVKRMAIERFGAAGLEELARRRGYAQNNHLVGVYEFQGEARPYPELLAASLRSACHADLVMSHPSTSICEGDRIGTARLVEFQVLASTTFGELLVAEGIGLRTMSAVLAASKLAR